MILGEIFWNALFKKKSNSHGTSNTLTWCRMKVLGGGREPLGQKGLLGAERDPEATLVAEVSEKHKPRSG